MSDDMTHWVSVIAKSLAYLGMEQGKFPSKTEQALFLEGIGLSTAEQAAMLGSTDASIQELKRIKRKGGSGAKSKNTKSTAARRSGSGRSNRKK